MRIGIANDSPTASEALRRAVALGGEHQVAWVARTGADAVRLCRDLPPDLVLMDLAMPVMDGVEATRAIRALPAPAGETPIIAMTANAMAHQQRFYMDAGMNGAVAKPLSPAALLAELAKLLASEEETAAAA